MFALNFFTKTILFTCEMKLSKLEIENLLREKSEKLKLNKVNSKSEVWIKLNN